MKTDYLSINKAAWNGKTDIHVDSNFYDNENFIKGKSSLNEIELSLLGNISGKKILHLQCHFGQDSISLARMGALVTGVDLSDKAIDTARVLSTKTNTNVTFINCDIYDLPNHLEDEFDMVFTTYGTIGWLPDINKWANVVAKFLKKGGKLVFVEFHPIMWMYDNDLEEVVYRYFNDAPIKEIEDGTYADKTAPIQNKSITWNHGLGEVMGSLLNAGIQIEDFQEYDYSPYDCFKDCIEFEKGKYRTTKFGNKVPMVYSVLGIKK